MTDGAVALDLDRRRLDAVDPVDRGLDQREAVARRRHDPAALLPRIAAHHEQHPVEVERRADLGGDDDVPDVHGIERAAEHAEPLRSGARHGGSLRVRAVSSPPGETLRVICRPVARSVSDA